MVGVVFNSTCLKGMNEGWNLVSKMWSMLPKRVAQEIHDEASFLALVDPKNRKSVRHVDTHNRYGPLRGQTEFQVKLETRSDPKADQGPKPNSIFIIPGAARRHKRLTPNCRAVAHCQGFVPVIIPTRRKSVQATSRS